jgi:hypothetical protein
MGGQTNNICSIEQGAPYNIIVIAVYELSNSLMQTLKPDFQCLINECGRKLVQTGMSDESAEPYTATSTITISSTSKWFVFRSFTVL